MTQVSRAHVRFSKSADYFCNIYQQRDNHVDEQDYSYLRFRSFPQIAVHFSGDHSVDIIFLDVMFCFQYL